MSTLKLSITNLGQLQHGIAASHQFDKNGGTLGRKGADWPLIDRECHVQPVHCEIRWIEGSFCVIDRCGRTYLNDSLMSLGGLAPVRLQDGDCLRIGAYQLSVSYNQDQTSDRRSLEELLDPTQRILDMFVASSLSGVCTPETSLTPNGSIDICIAVGTDIGFDPLAALEAKPVRQQKDPLQDFILRGEP